MRAVDPGLNMVEFQSGQATLRGVVFVPENALDAPVPGVVLCHGLTNRRHTCPLIQESATALQKAGFATFQFDFFGSGESDGEFKDKLLSILLDNLRDAYDFFRAIRQVDPTRIGLWGRSIGATLVTLLADKAKCSVVISPGFLLVKSFASWNTSPLDDGFVHLPQEQFTPQRQKDIKGDWKMTTLYFAELAHFEAMCKERALSMGNVLVVQGKADRTVEWKDTWTLYELFQPPKRLCLINNAEHDYKHAEDAAVSTVVGWFNLCLQGEILET